MTMTATRRTDTRDRILEVAEQGVLAKGFDATSIEEIVAAAEITKGGFFYHFPDKNALARALIERHIEREDAIFDGLFARARELSDDPLHSALIALRFLAELLADMPGGHPGCIVATAAYQDRLFDAGVRELNRQAALGWRRRFEEMFRAIEEKYTPRDAVDRQDLADLVSGVIEGGIVLAKALNEPEVTARQILALRSCIKLLYAPA